MQQYPKLQGVNFHTTHNPDIKNAVIERFNKIFKEQDVQIFHKNNIQLLVRHR